MIASEVVFLLACLFSAICRVLVFPAQDCQNVQQRHGKSIWKDGSSNVMREIVLADRTGDNVVPQRRPSRLGSRATIGRRAAKICLIVPLD
jgi:hypothetical protein